MVKQFVNCDIFPHCFLKVKISEDIHHFIFGCSLSICKYLEKGDLVKLIIHFTE